MFAVWLAWLQVNGFACLYRDALRRVYSNQRFAIVLDYTTGVVHNYTLRPGQSFVVLRDQVPAVVPALLVLALLLLGSVGLLPPLVSWTS